MYWHCTSDYTVLRYQKVSGVDSTCTACAALPGYSHSVTARWKVCDLTQQFPFLWPAGIPFVYALHLTKCCCYLHHLHAVFVTSDEHVLMHKTTAIDKWQAQQSRQTINLRQAQLSTSFALFHPVRQPLLAFVYLLLAECLQWCKS